MGCPGASERKLDAGSMRQANASTGAGLSNGINQPFLYTPAAGR